MCGCEVKVMGFVFSSFDLQFQLVCGCEVKAFHGILDYNSDKFQLVRGCEVKVKRLMVSIAVSACAWV